MIRRIKYKRFNNKKVLGLATLILIGGIVTGCNLNPIKKENQFSRIEFTSDGEYSETRQFRPFDSNNNKDLNNSFIYYDKWEEREDGKYQRNVKEYNINRKEYEDLKQIPIDEIDEALGKPTKDYTQIAETIPEEDINRDSYYDVTLYKEDEQKYVMVQDNDKSSWSLIASGTCLPLAIGALIGWNKYNEYSENKKNKKLTLKK